MKRYRVYFFWNYSGKAAVDTVCHCDFPDGWEVPDIAKGFWVDDSKTDFTNFEVMWACEPLGTMWVPPGRITAIHHIETGSQP